ncbi:MAG: metallophosphoesterase [Ktedonobacteraceae bacterium]|nr:metallophosphoesterase [Ktedonobacteraceae bacterium]
MTTERSPLKLSRRQALGCCGWALAAGVVAGGGALADAVYETSAIQETHITLRVPNLAPAFEGLTITQISDLHIHSFGDVERRLIHMLQSQPQQLIVITGDFVDDDSGIDAAMRVVNALRAEFGVWAVPGNVDYHDEYDDGNRPPIFARLRQAGVRLLINEHAGALQRGGEQFYLLGVDDPIHNFADIGDALQGLPADAPRILLAHSPDIATYEEMTQISLALVGHTHGGQIRLPLIPPALDHSPASQAYPAGFYRVGPTQLYVNRGIGTSHIPLRFGCQPEIAYVRLVAS